MMQKTENDMDFMIVRIKGTFGGKKLTSVYSGKGRIEDLALSMLDSGDVDFCCDVSAESRDYEGCNRCRHQFIVSKKFLREVEKLKADEHELCLMEEILKDKMNLNDEVLEEVEEMISYGPPKFSHAGNDTHNEPWEAVDGLKVILKKHRLMAAYKRALKVYKADH